MTRLLYIILTFLPLLTNGQITFSKKTDNKVQLYFPSFTFDCNKEIDNSSNEFWSSYLNILKKNQLNKDTFIHECYRLLYFGPYAAVLEVYNDNGKYIVIADSINSDQKKAFRFIDTLTAEKSFKLAETLNSVRNQFWQLKSYENCTQDKSFIFDDRDNWVIEIKIGNKYHAIERIIPDSNLTKFIITFMDIGNLHGYNIYYNYDNYKTY